VRPLSSPHSIAVRALRADAARNRARILAAAAELFAERGLDASTAEIAHRAGVGEATLFRRFPTKDDLIVAICGDQMDEVIAVANDCVDERDPWRGIERFVREMVQRRIEDRGAMEAIKHRCMAKPELDSRRREMLDVMSALVRRAQAAGALRADLTGQDLGFLITAAAAVGGQPFPGLREDLWKRYVGVILDGMRPEGASQLRPGSPSRRVFEPRR
jgi:AcrR family transcriptional regulator